MVWGGRNNRNKRKQGKEANPFEEVGLFTKISDHMGFWHGSWFLLTQNVLKM